jgi:hypothetical protein
MLGNLKLQPARKAGALVAKQGGLYLPKRLDNRVHGALSAHDRQRGAQGEHAREAFTRGGRGGVEPRQRGGELVQQRAMEGLCHAAQTGATLTQHRVLVRACAPLFESWRESAPRRLVASVAARALPSAASRAPAQ